MKKAPAHLMLNAGVGLSPRQARILYEMLQTLKEVFYLAYEPEINACQQGEDKPNDRKH